MALDDFGERGVLEFQRAREAAVDSAEFEIDRLDDRRGRYFGEGAALDHRRLERELRREADLDFRQPWWDAGLVVDHRHAALAQLLDTVGASRQREARTVGEWDLQPTSLLDPDRARQFAALPVEGDERIQTLDDARPPQRVERGVGEQRREGGARDRHQPLARLLGRQLDD